MWPLWGPGWRRRRFRVSESPQPSLAAGRRGGAPLGPAPCPGASERLGLHSPACPDPAGVSSGWAKGLRAPEVLPGPPTGASEWPVAEHRPVHRTLTATGAWSRQYCLYGVCCSVLMLEKNFFELSRIPFLSPAAIRPLSSVLKEPVYEQLPMPQQCPCSSSSLQLLSSARS